jgi:hypothetical protein
LKRFAVSLQNKNATSGWRCRLRGAVTGTQSMEEQINQHQDECRHTQQPSQEILTHDRAPLTVVWCIG